MKNYEQVFRSLSNKYGENTHQKEFDLLKELKGEKVKNALAWIRSCYDCYYKNENDENGPFEYLRLCAKGVESEQYIKMFMDDNNLKVGEEFRIKGYDLSGTWHFDENGKLLDSTNNEISKVLGKYLQGEYEVEKVKKEPWKPKLGEDYYFVSCTGLINWDKNDGMYDECIVSHNLVFQTKEEAEDYKWFLDKVDEYKKPFKYRDDNFCFYYDHDDNELSKLNLKQTCYQGTIYFGGLENIENFLEEVGEERIKKYMFNIWE